MTAGDEAEGIASAASEGAVPNPALPVDSTEEAVDGAKDNHIGGLGERMQEGTPLAGGVGDAVEAEAYLLLCTAAVGKRHSTAVAAGIEHRGTFRHRRQHFRSRSRHQAGSWNEVAVPASVQKEECSMRTGEVAKMDPDDEPGEDPIEEQTADYGRSDTDAGVDVEADERDADEDAAAAETLARELHHLVLSSEKLQD